MTPDWVGDDLVNRVSRNTLRKRALVLASLSALGLVTSDVSAAPALSGAFGALVHADAVTDGDSYTRFIVKYRNDTPAGLSIAGANANIDATAGRVGRGLSHVRRLAIGADLVEVSGAAMASAEAQRFMRDLADDPNVEYVEPDRRYVALHTPNDTRYAEQWHYFDAVAGMNLPAAWDLATGTGVTVAVLDTGITAHADLSANIVAGYDFVSDAATARDGNGRDANPNDEGDWFAVNECGVPYSSSSSWHGTHVAGTIAAVTGNASGVAGVAFGAKVQPVRVLGKCGGSTADIADAIVWASGGTVSGVTANPTPAKVINLSLGGGGACGSTFQNAINSAVGRGTVLVIAAGNDNANVSTASPANCSSVIAVAASDKEGNRASYSNYGTLIDVTAPGGETATAAKGVLSTLNAGTTTPGSASYAFYQGTSMATPHVAGLAALILSKGAKTPAEIESLMKANTRPLAGTCSGGCGAGLVDAAKTLQALSGGPGPGGTVLENGIAKTGLTASTGQQLDFTMVVPAGATGLSFAMSGGTGDADLYVRFGAAPTTSVYDCRPYQSGNNETCNIATAQAGTYYLSLRAYATFSGVSLVGNYTAGGGGGQTLFSNATDYAIADNATVESPIAVSGRTGNAPAALQVAVDIRHTYKGDLKVDLVAPDGTVYVLHNRTGASTDNIIQTYAVNASSEVANGTWKLRVNDDASGDTGYINQWSMQF